MTESDPTRDPTRVQKVGAESEADPTDDFLYGDELGAGAAAGDYTIEGRLASGGCGTVYVARHRTSGREAAIKVLHRDISTSPQMVERFLREAQTVNRIRHPNIIEIYDMGRLPDARPYYVMELLHGTDLADYLRPRGRLTPAETLAILDPVCAGLEAAHEAGVIHRDLKAGNIFVGFERVDPRVTLLDFGVAKLLQPDVPQADLSASMRIGTPSTMAPEQILGGTIDPRTDVYALGVLLFLVLTGRLPFVASDPLELQGLHLLAPPPRVSDYAAASPAIDKLVQAAMAKDLERRIGSAAEFAETLRDAVGSWERRSPSGRVPALPAVYGMAFYVEARLPPGSEEELDATQLDDLMVVLEMSEAAMRDAGFHLDPALQTGNAALGLRVLPRDPGVAERERARAVAAAEALAPRIAARDNATPGLHVNVSLHVDKAVLRVGSEHQIAGGAVARVGGWAPQEDVPGVYLTPDWKKQS